MVHIYRHAGVYFPSVTTIIGATMPVPEGLAQWKIRSGAAGHQKMLDSQIIGTLAHYRILNKLSPSLLNPPNFSPDDLPKGAIEKIDTCEIMWNALNLNIGHPRKIERLLYSKEHTFAGSPDMVAPIDNVYTLVDLKTSKDIYESHRLQMGGYYDLLGRTPEQCMLVSIHPDPYKNPNLRASISHMTKEDLETYRERFLKLVKTFHEMCLTEKLMKEHGLSHDEESVVGSD